MSLFTLGDLSKRFGVPIWAVRALFLRSLLPEPRRVGAYRVVPETDLPKIEQALRTAGYLPREEVAVAP
jgi:hypothetical protein